jgi:hypothetical protein
VPVPFGSRRLLSAPPKVTNRVADNNASSTPSHALSRPCTHYAAMGRPRRGHNGAEKRKNQSDKENAAAGDTQQRRRAASRHVSRPWDNLKPVRASTYLPRDGEPQSTTDFPSFQSLDSLAADAVAGHDRAKLPHERFTPLLRTAFSGDATTTGADSFVLGRGGDLENSSRDLGGRSNKKTVAAYQRAKPKAAKTPPTPVATEQEPDVSQTALKMDLHQDLANYVGSCRPAAGPLDVCANAPEIQNGSSMSPSSFTRSYPSRTTHRHSIRSGRVVLKSTSSDDEGEDDPEAAITDEDGGCPLKPWSDSDIDKEEELIGDLDEQCDNSAFLTIPSVDSPLQSPSLDGFRRSVRISISHSYVRNSAARHSVRGLPVDHSMDLRQPTFQEFDDHFTLDLPHDRAEVDVGSPDFSFVDEENSAGAMNQLVGIPQSQMSAKSGPRSRDISDEPSMSMIASEASSPSFPPSFPTNGVVSDAMKLVAAPPELQVPVESPRIATDGSEKPCYPVISRSAVVRQNDGGGPRHFKDLKLSRMKGEEEGEDDDGAIFDGPAAMMNGVPDIEPALRDLQRASIKAGHELAIVAFGASTAQRKGVPPADRVSRAQGELSLRSRILRRWNSRFASVVDHAYFGAVLFLFCLDAKETKRGGLALKNSKMIVLADTHVQEVDVRRRSRVSYLLELRTAQRRYVFCCDDERQRNYWVSNLTRYIA